MGCLKIIYWILQSLPWCQCECWFTQRNHWWLCIACLLMLGKSFILTYHMQKLNKYMPYSTCLFFGYCDMWNVGQGHKALQLFQQVEQEGESTLWSGHFKQKNVLFWGYILVYFGDTFSLISFNILINI